MVKSQIVGLVELENLASLLETNNEDARSFMQQVLSKQVYKDKLLLYNQRNLDLGIRPDETEIQKNPTTKQQSTKYERYTIYLKNKMGFNIDQDSPVTLKDTGNFRSKIDVKIGYNGIIFVDRDSKSEILESIWGSVLGITEQQLFEFTELILPEFEDWAIKRYEKFKI